MSRGFRFTVRHLRLRCGIVVLVGYLVCANCALPGGELVVQKVMAAEAGSEERFDNPESITKAFVSQLNRMARTAGAASPSVLSKQLEAAKRSHHVEIMAAPTEKLSSETIYTRARAGVVIIGAIPGADHPERSEPTFASGFVVHKNGVIVSNAHVVEAFRDMKAIGVMTADGRVFPIATVLAADRLNDVALYKIDANNLTPLPVARSVPVGATIYCLSHPVIDSAGTAHGFFAFTQGIVSGRYRTKLLDETPLNVLTITADYAQGSSGGPILDQQGAVVGIVCHTLAIGDDDGGNQMVWKFARPASSILSLLGNAKAPVK
jgi:serine protease Do